MSESAPPLPTGVLREPQQERSREKVTRILAAATRLLAERPYEEIGTKLIAAEAGVSIGVLYRFFPDKLAIATTLMAHWIDDFTALTTTALAGPLPADARELTARVLDAHVHFRREQPAYRSLSHDGPPLPALRGYDEAGERRLAGAIRTVLVRHYGYPDTPAFALRTELAVSTTGRLLGTAFRSDPQGDPAVLAEIRRMLDGWLLAGPPAAD
ncbi:TetR/AcrR family transcriptional regulator [Kitasatospora sp. LaBMicrA B282]|uniref:TetR/AcrR family transcriptional regulator n=1 Tax=Kitasatospora sp. LaBMicrA B282 TaxID=3420949 RepID=UPI003D0FA949